MIPLRAVGRAPLHTLLWIAQAALVIAFELTGVLKSCVPTLQLQGELHLLAGVPEAILPLVGTLAAAGAVLLLLPSTLRILPALAPLAAAALGGVALLGATVPATGAALAMPLPNLILAALAAFVAWGRWLPARIRAVPLRAAGAAARARAGESGAFPNELLPAATLSPHDAVENKWREQALAQALLQIPEKLRAAFVLVNLEGLSVAEAADALGITPGNVKRERRPPPCGTRTRSSGGRRSRFPRLDTLLENHEVTGLQVAPVAT